MPTVDLRPLLAMLDARRRPCPFTGAACRQSCAPSAACEIQRDYDGEAAYERAVRVMTPAERAEQAGLGPWEG